MKPESSDPANTEHSHGPQRPAPFWREVLAPSNVQVAEINVESLAEIREELHGIVSVHAEVLGDSSFKGKLMPTRYWAVVAHKGQNVLFQRSVDLPFAGHALAIIVGHIAILNCRKQALAQACAVYSPKYGSMSEMAMLRQQSL